jgi:hypothetical protein
LTFSPKKAINKDAMQNSFSYDKLKEKLRFYLKNGKNVLLEGKHGTAKTTIISEILNEELGAENWLYFSASTLDPWVDFIGVPRETKNADGKEVLGFVLPERMSNPNILAIYLDEYNRSDKKLRNAVMELVQFKSINGNKFPNLKVVWAAVNPYSDEEMDQRYDVEMPDMAQMDRFQVQIKVPYFPDFNYLSNKFGEEWAKAAIEWWTELKEESKNAVSPRRLDYALEIALIGGDCCDVLPFETNPQKLALTLEIGNIEDKLNEIVSSGDYESAKEFINKENNYQGAKKFISENKTFMKMFLPMLSDERVVSLFYSDEKIRNFILKNSLLFQDALVSMSSNEKCEYLPQIKAALRKTNGVVNMTYNG